MFTVTVPRADVTTEEVASALRQRLSLRYAVVPGVGVNWNPVGEPRRDHPDSVVVSIGRSRLFRAQVKLSRDGRETVLRVSPGGLTALPRLVNRAWIVRQVVRALKAAPELVDAR